MVDHDSPYENKALKHGHLIDIPSTEVSEEFGPTGGAWRGPSLQSDMGITWHWTIYGDIDDERDLSRSFILRGLGVQLSYFADKLRYDWTLNEFHVVACGMTHLQILQNNMVNGACNRLQPFATYLVRTWLTWMSWTQTGSWRGWQWIISMAFP